MDSFHVFRTIFILCVAMLQGVCSKAQPVTEIAAGYDFSFFIRGDGSLWATGLRNYGELGDGSNYDQVTIPEMIVPGHVTAVAAGLNYSLFLKDDGSLWAMGDNDAGQLGDGSNNPTNYPEMIVASNVTAIATRYEHSLFIQRDGSLWAMGRNDFGQLGDGTYNFTNQPEMIVASNVTAIAAGAAHSLFLKADGSLWGMGLGDSGQLCDGSYMEYPSPVCITNGVKAIAAGYYHSLLLMTNGSVWAAGDDSFGEIGNGEFNFAGVTTPVEIVASNGVAVAAGDDDSFFIMNDGSLWAMGQNDLGQLGDGQYDSDYPNAGTNTPQRILTSNVAAVAAGDQQTLLLRTDGSLWGMGNNFNGQLGAGNAFVMTNLPVEIIAAPPGYNRIQPQLLSGGKVALAYTGNANATYILDRSFSLSPPNWIPQATNTANSSGTLVFTNSVVSNSNNFWRVRSAP